MTVPSVGQQPYLSHTIFQPESSTLMGKFFQWVHDDQNPLILKISVVVLALIGLAGTSVLIGAGVALLLGESIALSIPVSCAILIPLLSLITVDFFKFQQTQESRRLPEGVPDILVETQLPPDLEQPQLAPRLQEEPPVLEERNRVLEEIISRLQEERQVLAETRRTQEEVLSRLEEERPIQDQIAFLLEENRGILEETGRVRDEIVSLLEKEERNDTLQAVGVVSRLEEQERLLQHEEDTEDMIEAIEASKSRDLESN